MRGKHILHIAILLAYAVFWVIFCLQPYGRPFYYRMAGFIGLPSGFPIIIGTMSYFDAQEIKVLVDTVLKSAWEYRLINLVN